MGYDLYFCRRTPGLVSIDDAQHWADKHTCFERTTDQQLWYENPDTGVYFSLDFVEETDSPLPEGWSQAGVVFNLNYARPTFFSLEAMPIVEDLARAFELCVFDPQTEQAPGPPDVNALVAAYRVGNEQAAHLWAQKDSAQHPALYMARDRARYWWEYQKGKAHLESELEARDIFVPKLMLLRRAGSRRVQTALTFTPGVHMIVPEFDTAVIVRKKKRLLLGKKDEVGNVSAETLLGEIGEYLEEFDSNRKLRVLPKKNAEAVAEILARTEVVSGLTGFTQARSDEFQDAVELQ
jgi:hypothetical protein